jgi:hypothetical protein
MDGGLQACSIEVALLNTSMVAAVVAGRTRKTQIWLFVIGALISSVFGGCLQAILGFPSSFASGTLWNLILLAMGSSYY